MIYTDDSAMERSGERFFEIFCSWTIKKIYTKVFKWKESTAKEVWQALLSIKYSAT